MAALARGFAKGFSDAIHSAEYLKCEAACSLDALIGSAIPFEISIGNAFYRYDDNWNWQDAVSLNVPSLSIGAFEMFERLQYNDMGGDFLENRLKDLLTRENSKIGMRHRRQLEAKLAKLNTAHRNILLAKQASVILAIANALKDYWDCYEKHCKKCLEADNNN